jgi:hypothetical protein
MDMIAAYNGLGSYGGAATICGVDHKTMRAVAANGQMAPLGRPVGTTTTWWPTLSPNGWPRPRPAFPPNASRQRQEPLVMTAPPQFQAPGG